MIHRHAAKTNELKAKSHDVLLEYVAAGICYLLVARKEDHAHTIFARCGKFKAQPGGLFSQKIMRQLYENPSSVTGFGIAALASAMLHVLQHRERVAQYVVRPGSIDVCYESDAACIVLKLWCV